jgi:WD40 repeat protein
VEGRQAAGAGWIQSLTVLADGRLASGGSDGKIKLWDGAGEPVVLSQGRPVASLAALPDGRLASADQDGKIKLWLTHDADEPKVLWDGNGNVWIFALAALRDGLVSGGQDGEIRLWSKVGTGEPITLFHGSEIHSLAVLQDGRLASGGEDGNVKLWPKERTGAPVVLRHGGLVLSLAVLADGRLASGGDDGKIRLWLVDEQKLIAALCLRAGRILQKKSGPVTSAPTLPGSRVVATFPQTGGHPTCKAALQYERARRQVTLLQILMPHKG